MGLIFTCEEVARKIKQFSIFEMHHLIEVPANHNVDDRISHHSDLSVAIIQNQVFIEPSCFNLVFDKVKSVGYGTEHLYCGETRLNKVYPYDIAYNVLPMEGKLFHKVAFTDAILKKNTKLELIDVNQGYTRCSVLPVGHVAAITSDEGLYRILKTYGYNVLKIRAGHVLLGGYSHGFIGGVGGVVEDYMVFNGSLDSHPDGDKMRQFILDQNYKIIELHRGPLEDVGSILYSQR